MARRLVIFDCHVCGKPHAHIVSYAPQNQSHHFEINVFTSTAWPLYQRSVCIKLYNEPNGKIFVKIFVLLVIVCVCVMKTNAHTHTQCCRWIFLSISLSLSSYKFKRIKRSNTKNKIKIMLENDFFWRKVKNTQSHPKKIQKTWMKNY